MELDVSMLNLCVNIISRDDIPEIRGRELHFTIFARVNSTVTESGYELNSHVSDFTNTFLNTLSADAITKTDSDFRQLPVSWLDINN